MKKEILTLNAIKKDMKNEIKNSYVRLTVFSLVFLAFFGLYSSVRGVGSLFIIYEVAFGLSAILMLILVILQVKDIVKLHIAMKDKSCIVKDKLIGMEIKDHQHGLRLYHSYHLNFSSYGEYLIQSDNYKWSSMYNLSDKGLYNYSKCGDEFYLILSKRHTGKILMVYNTKLFELEN